MSDELREKVEEIIKELNQKHAHTSLSSTTRASLKYPIRYKPFVKVLTDSITQLIEAECVKVKDFWKKNFITQAEEFDKRIKAECVKARIDELENCPADLDCLTWFDERIAQLKESLDQKRN